MLGPTSSINNYPNIFGVQSGLSIEQLAKTMSAGQTAMPTDSLTISSSGNMLQQLLNAEMQGDGTSAEMGELDLLGLTQLKQRGEMLASMLQLKLKNFESNLMSSMKDAGVPMQDMQLKNGAEGMELLGDMPNKESIQNAIGGLSGDFNDISRIAEVLNMLKQLGPEGAAKELSGLAGFTSAAKYAQQSLPEKSPMKQSEADFVLQVSQSGTAFY